MKLLKTFLIALSGLVLFNCSTEHENQLQKTEFKLDLNTAKSTFEATYVDHLNFVLKTTNRVSRGEAISTTSIEENFEMHWSSLAQSLTQLVSLMSEQEARVYLNSLIQEKHQGVAETPCYDAYINEFNEAGLDLVVCFVTSYAGGDSPAMCTGTYLNQLRRAYNNYNTCIEKEYSKY